MAGSIGKVISAGARAIPIAAMRPTTPAYLHRVDERHLNPGGSSIRQKTRFDRDCCWGPVATKCAQADRLERPALCRRRSQPVRKPFNGLQAPYRSSSGQHRPSAWLSSRTIGAAGRRPDLDRVHSCRQPFQLRHQPPTGPLYGAQVPPCTRMPRRAAVPGLPAIAVTVRRRWVILSVRRPNAAGDCCANRGACQYNPCCRAQTPSSLEC
jgi:hypothetical protein